MKSNFEFLNRYWPALAQIGAAAESYVYSDPNACLYKLGMFGERLILEIFAFEHIKEPTIDNTHANRIRLLKREDLIPKKIDDILYALRKTRNDAVHAGADSVEDAKTLLSMTYNLAVWFMEVYGDWEYIAPAFVMPENVAQPDYEAIIKEQEEKIAALSKQVEAVSTAASSKTSKERAEKGETASESMELSEAETRYLIDKQLRKFGWEADTNNLRYSKGTRPQKGRNLAIAEWPTDSAVGKNGYADYALFAGLKKAYYTTLLFDGKLVAHLNEIDDVANAQMNLISKQMAKSQGITEALKAQNQFAWVGAMNNIRNAAEEIILSELIYSKS